MGTKKDNKNNETFHLQTGIGPMTDKFLNSILEKINSDAFRKRVGDAIIGPFSDTIDKKVKPYICTMFSIYGVVILLLLIIIYLLMIRRKC